MSRYLIDQLATRPNIRTLLAAEVTAAHGDVSLEAIDIRESATGSTTRYESGGLYIFIGADAETAWLPPGIALDGRGYVLTGADMRGAGHWELDRDPTSWRQACQASSRAEMCGSTRSSALPPR
jgi:thioredoxin reductase (NADPH)